MLLGEKEIKKLSASDCFLILHVVYIHDIGMCITDQYRENLMKREDFRDFLKNCQGDIKLREYAEILLAHCRELEEQAGRMKFTPLQTKLKVYQAVIYLVAEFRRKDHSQESQKILSGWIKDNGDLGAGFSTSGIPSRFFETIGACASVHTSSDFGDIMKLSKQDGGYAQDYMHPRFAAVLLQLGDALDLDNDRFHPLIKEFLNGIPEMSSLHFGKHKSIRRLRINPRKISIHADCEKAEELRLVQREYEGIRAILKDATFHWSAICPEELGMVLPELEPLRLQLNGKSIEESLANAKFEIQQAKAFNLLKGSNIYRNERFVFLREIFQNAVDASKKEYWLEWLGSRWRKEGIEQCEDYLSPYAYPIEIEFHLAVREKYGKEISLLDSREEYEQYGERIKNGIFGVIVKMTDYGTGISKSDILEITKVGSTYNKDRKPWKDMPSWLQTTGEFGIGLQTVFLVADSFTAQTNVRNGERYKLEFHETGEKGNGFINVTPVDEADDTAMKSFGTCFEIFVTVEKIREILAGQESGIGGDPFSEAHTSPRELAEAREIAVRMFLYLDEIIGEKLFPVRVSIFDFQKENNFYKKVLMKRKMQLKPAIIIDKTDIFQLDNQNGFTMTAFNMAEKKGKLMDAEDDITWIYSKQKGKQQYYETKRCEYWVDFKRGKFFLADKGHNWYVCLSAERILQMRRAVHSEEADDKNRKTKVYYKGVYVTEYGLEEDLDLLEYIDIKGMMEASHLAVNRSEFTASGEAYIRRTIYPQILDYVREALEDFFTRDEFKQLLDETNENKDKGRDRDEDKDRDKNEYRDKDGDESRDKNEDKDKNKSKGYRIESIVLGDLKEKDTINDADTEAEIIHKRILLLIGMAVFMRTYSYTTYLFPMVSREKGKVKTSCDKLLKSLSEFIKEYAAEHMGDSGHWASSTFYNLTAYKIDKQNVIFSFKKNLAEVFHSSSQYAIISKRRDANSRWNEVLLELRPEDSIKDKIGKLKTEKDLEKAKELIQKIESWPSQIGGFVSNIFDPNDLDTTNMTKPYNEHTILNWLLKNIPSIAVFADESNNVRINILNPEYTDSVYLSTSLKYSIYERMASIYRKEGIQRFCTVAATAFCQLGVNRGEINKNIYFLKRGKFGKIGRRYVIMPITGQTIDYLFQTVRENEMVQIIELFEGIAQTCQTISRYITTGNTENLDEQGKRFIMDIKASLGGDPPLPTIYHRIFSRLNGYLSEETITLHAQLEESDAAPPVWEITMALLRDDADAEQKIKAFMKEKWIMLSTMIREVDKDTKDWIDETLKICLQKHFGYVKIDGRRGMRPDDDREPDQKKILEDMDRTKDRLLEYVEKNSWLHNITKEQVEELYCLFIDDILKTIYSPLISRIKHLGKLFC